LKKAGVLKEPLERSRLREIDYVVLCAGQLDPLDSKCQEAADLAKKSGCDGIVAIGGGSTMDCAKAADILIANPSPLYKYYGSWDYKKGVPLICVPTTAGTGSENTIYGVINATEGPDAGMKKVILYTADLAICDPVLTYKLPKALTAATGLDAFAHCAESVTCNIENPLVEVLAMDGISRVCKYLPIA
jgi:alcohol dehydrogenase class IV